MQAVVITVQVPPELAHRLHPFRERLPEPLERGWRMVTLEERVKHQDEATTMEILTSNPTPERVMALRVVPL
jgi:hypothetical protein